MIETVVSLPEMDLAGLSENWLFKHCGERHWQSVCSSFGRPAHQVTDGEGHRLYPAFVSVRGRYAQPLCAVREGDRFETRVTTARYGRAFFQSQVAFAGERGTFELEMVTTFVRRRDEASNDLRHRQPAHETVQPMPSLDAPPAPLRLSRALRQGEEDGYRILDRPLPPPADLGGPFRYEPSPYVDYNGVGLLYFAAYPTIVDTMERRLVSQLRLLDTPRDWALSTSTVWRDVFYHRNLGLGAGIGATLKRFEVRGDLVVTHTVLAAAEDGGALGDVITARRLVG